MLRLEYQDPFRMIIINKINTHEQPLQWWMKRNLNQRKKPAIYLYEPFFL